MEIVGGLAMSDLRVRSKHTDHGNEKTQIHDEKAE